MTTVFIANTSFLKEDLSVYYDRVSDYRCKKIEGLKKPDDKKRSLLGELILSLFLGRKPSYIIDKNGKPCGEEIWFNISHSGDYAVCAISDMPVGVDIQQIRKINPDVAVRFGKAEYERIVNSAHPTDAFFELWVKKESALKAEGLGIKQGLDFELPEKYRYTMCRAIDGYKICVASQGPAEFKMLTERDLNNRINK